MSYHVSAFERTPNCKFMTILKTEINKLIAFPTTIQSKDQPIMKANLCDYYFSCIRFILSTEDTW